MNFTLTKNSPLPVYVQIQEQIKLALLLGRLRPGDTLPSIRDVATQLGVNRGIVYKAYMQMQASGILSLHKGKGVLVDKAVKYNHGRVLADKVERLSDNLFSKIRNMGVSPSAFARYFQQMAWASENSLPFIIFVDVTKAQAVERAARISSLWQVHIEGVSIDELPSMDTNRLQRVRKAVASYLRVDQVRKALRKTSIEVIPIGLRVKESTLDEFAKFPADISILLIMDDHDYPAHPFVVDLYRKELWLASADITAIPLSKAGDPLKLLKSSKYDRFIFATRIWETLPERLKRHPRVTHPQLDIDLASVESARISAGVIV